MARKKEEVTKVEIINTEEDAKKLALEEKVADVRKALKSRDHEEDLKDSADGEFSDEEDLEEFFGEENDEYDIEPFDENKPVTFEVEGLAQISKSVKQSVVNIDRNQLKYLVDAYYQSQKYRIAIQSQIRAIVQGFDQSINGDDEVPLSLQWLFENMKNQEKQIQNMLDAYTSAHPIGNWVKQIKGIGPVIAAGLIGYLDYSKVNHYNQFHSYAGLNDNNVKWLGKAGSAKIVKEIWEDLGKDKDDTNVDEYVIAQVVNRTHRTISSVLNGLTVKDRKGNQTYTPTKKQLESYLAKPPYNSSLKTLCWKIGQSFVKQCNRKDSLYGILYKERKIYEISMNEKGEFADQAAAILAEKNIGKGTDAYKWYSEGKLPPAHIDQRAQRWTTKLLIAHLYQAMEYYETGEVSVPYPIAYLGHVDYIAPEVPFETIKRKTSTN